MLDHDITMKAGWQTAWLERTLPALRCYANALSYAMSLAIVFLAVKGFLAMHRGNKALRADPSRRSEIFSVMNKKVHKVTKGHFYVAVIYLVNVFVFAMVDALIGAFQLGKDAVEDPEAWTTQLVFELVLYVVFLLAVFGATFFLFPLLQMLLVTYGLSRISEKRGSNSLADYIPEARFTSTHLAELWCLVCFCIEAWWSPAAGYSLWRYTALHACFGSALTWLDVSFVFNFCSDKLQDEDLAVNSGGVKELLKLFSKTAQVAHSRSEKTGLPKYEDVPQEAPAVATDEKTELL